MPIILPPTQLEDVFTKIQDPLPHRVQTAADEAVCHVGLHDPRSAMQRDAKGCPSGLLL